ncbi:MAG: caspase family protein [Microcoleus sp. PH2017_10_PVI_O_A]|uniref:caspase family protein n=1 Tax=unclassified Microcoleus TaxID=2642155 RepID=UPI001D6C307A|nr:MULTISPECIES: caspase family protein [unclassified Microcoleus]TAE80054.1 MAG: caspase family protein [Oscillatoriales cyanobacterium]MCC3407758.1 caspase family protein [Microcoleus sp. PH2017_10_PVI_O_A]MCC3461940.1 caspase family protein [Microcoleus sp. PH2017_11_PCY_U_A]MCC3480388.1 caspase family protein [Microcoleus sp. PH2017_12_PCY_D_A]MCC3530081.1 caspase family protein [Microcoleus sp. PH2017_21_RUC_O_A]
MGLKRREFLQQAGRVLAALGISEAGWLRLGSRYSEALAQPTARKLALLVGVDQYPDSPLHGCVTDVELQRELLIYRFGFAPSDILTLTDARATRENIETAFVSHLSEQAKPGDVVVFHFSGCGSRVSSIDSPAKMQNSLVPADDVVPLLENRSVNDILEETLLQLVRSLATENAIAILDTSYSYPGFLKNGNFRIRSRPRPTIGQPSLAELTFAKGLQSGKNNSRAIALLSAAANSQIAGEQQWNGFTAGLFTYALTQTLWLATPASSFSLSFSRAAGTVEQRAGLSQQPQIRRDNLTTAPALNFATSLMLNSAAADGAVTGVEDGGKTVQLWLGGLSAGVLECCEGSVFAVDAKESDSLEDSSYTSRLLLRSRSGLSAKAQILDKLDRTEGQLTAGDLVREEIRVLPRNIGLTVALDSGLERIERVDATSAFATVPQISAVASEQPADFRFGRVPETIVAQTPAAYEPALYQGRYGLFSVGQMPVPDTQGDGGEAVKVAVQRLIPQLKALQAAKLLRLTVNETSSRLKVRAVLATLAPQARVMVQRESVRASGDYRLQPLSGETEKSSNLGILSLPIGSRIQYRLYNESGRPVYAAVFSSDSAGRLSVLGTEEGMSRAIAPGDNVSVPAAGALGLAVSGALGLAETLIIVSEGKFDRAMAAMEMQQTRDTLPLVLLNPLNVARAVLEDLHAASIPGVQKLGISTDDLALDVNVWATLSFVYRVV